MLLYRRIAAILMCAVLIACACLAAAAETGHAGEELRLSARKAKLTVTGSRVVAKGKKITLKASEAVTWKSSNKKIAKVSRDGTVKGIKAGSVTITATSKANRKTKKTITVTVMGKAVKKIHISAASTEINLKKKKTLQLEASVSPASADQYVEWASSDTKVAKVSKNGKVTAAAYGTVVITASARDGSGKQASIEITVKDPDNETPEKIRIGEGEAEIRDEAWFGSQELNDAEIADSVKRIGFRAFAQSSLRYVYIPSSVTLIEEDAFDQCPRLACLTPADSYAAGWCDAHGVARYAPDYITAIVPSATDLTVSNGGEAKVKLSIRPSVSRAKPVLSSSDEKIFTVKDKKIFGRYPGQAELTALSKDGTVSARIRVTVQANYRAVLFSESTFEGGVIQRNRGDVRLMQQMLEAVTGPDGGKYRMTSYDDLVAKEVYAKITKDLIEPSRDGDVSIFFFASHGDYRSTSEQYAGRLWCKNKQTWLELPTLAQTLSKVRGKVIVLLESCGPGAAIHRDGTAGDGQEEDVTEKDARAFAKLVVSAFSDADPGLTVWQAAGGTAEKTDGPFVTKKFVVMTAADYLQVSYMYGPDKCNLFPVWLTRGVGTAGKMAADTEFGNGDGKLTVNELYQYVYKYTKYKQTPMVYPANSDYVLFLRRK